MKKILPGIYSRIRKNIGIILTAGFYFGFLAYTMYCYISNNGITENILQLAIIVTVFAVFSYIMFFSSKNRLKKRHVLQNTELEFEITKKRIIFDWIIAVLFLITGVVLMILIH